MRERTNRSCDDQPKARVLALKAFYASMHKSGVHLHAIFIAPNYDHTDVVVLEVWEEAGIPPKFDDLKKVFSKTKAQAVAKHGPHDLTINHVEGKGPPW